jgi:hypothetical protein
MIGEIALGIKLTNDAITLGKSAVEGCAKIINNCKDPSEVSGHLDHNMPCNNNKTSTNIIKNGIIT